MGLTVVIPTRDRADLLTRALHSLTAQTLDAGRFEVLVADNGTADATAEACEAFSGRLPDLRRIEVAEPGLHAGRHAGLSHARGDILVYADDDIRAEPTWLEAVAEVFRDPAVSLVGGRCLPEWETAPPAWVDALWVETAWGRALTAYSLLDFGDQERQVPPEWVFGCNFSIRARVLRELGGFHPDAMPQSLRMWRGDGETAVSRALAARGEQARYHPEATVHHWVARDRLTLDYLKRRAFAQGISDSYTDVRRRGGPSLAAMARDRWRYTRRGLRLGARWLLGRTHRVHLLAHRAYWRGVLAHQRAVRRDPELLAWVLRPTYLDS